MKSRILAISLIALSLSSNIQCAVFDKAKDYANELVAEMDERAPHAKKALCAAAIVYTTYKITKFFNRPVKNQSKEIERLIRLVSSLLEKREITIK